MPTPHSPASSAVDAYVASFPPEIRQRLQQVRSTVRKIAPQAQKRISCRMPAFELHGMLLYVGAFKHHIGVYPPVRGDAELERALAPHAGENGNLRFANDQPFPHRLIERIVALRRTQNLAKHKARQAG